MIDPMALVFAFGAAIAGAAGALAGVATDRRRRAPVVLEEQHCTGYPASDTYGMRIDCMGLRNPTCVDGRCSFHCQKSCKCDASNEPELVDRSRRS